MIDKYMLPFRFYVVSRRGRLRKTYWHGVRKRGGKWGRASGGGNQYPRPKVSDSPVQEIYIYVISVRLVELIIKRVWVL